MWAIEKYANKGFSIFVFILVHVCASSPLWALPQYTTHLGVNRCTLCHVSPVGGGLRNLDGKYFGFSSMKPSKWGSQDLVSMDARALYYYPQKATSSKGGFGQMAVNLGANIPLSDLATDHETRFVTEYNLGGFGGTAGGARDTYVRWRFYPEGDYHWYPQYALVGRLRTPFGLQTDEHRTFTKIQTKSGWNDFDAGGLFSGDWGPLHYDLALTSGTKTGGTALGQGVAPLWGAVSNLRYTPSFLPLTLGSSYAYYEAPTSGDSPRAYTFYTLISIARLTGERLPLHFLAEMGVAENFNPYIVGFFTDSAYQTSLANTWSEAVWLELDWAFSGRLNFTYKLDTFTPDREFPADYYERHGVGLKYRTSAHVSFVLRGDWSHATPPSETDPTGTGGQDAGWFILKVNL